jgi:hypothetical protein
MFAQLLLALLSPAAPALAPAPPVQQQALRLWLNRQGTLDRGEKVRVYTRTADDGYLFVLHVEPDGRVRVLFPLDPLDDNFIRAGQDYEIRNRGDREAFQIYESSGAGTVFAALSPSPFRFDPLVLNGHWDYRSAEWNMTGDPEADLSALAGRLAAGDRFDYDIQRYVVGGYVAQGGDWYEPSLYYDGYDPYWYGSRFSIHVGFGHRYSRYWYDPWDWGSWWDPWWYPSSCWYGCYGGWPYYYTPVYYPYRYYTYPYYGPNRYVYVTSPGYGGSGGRYTFKSSDDRYGLAPDRIGARRRTLTDGAVGARTAPSRTGTATTGRRAPSTASGPADRTPDARSAPARRPASQPAAGPQGTRTQPRATPDRRPSGGSTGGATPSRPPASRPSGGPTRRQLSQDGRTEAETPAVGERLNDGSYRLPSPPRRSITEVAPDREPVGTLERRAETEPRTVTPGGGRETRVTAPRGLRIADDAPAPSRGSSSGGVSERRGTVGSSARPSGPTREVQPRPAPSTRAPVGASDSRRSSPSTRPAPTSRAPSTRSAPTPSSRAPSARPAPRSSPPTRSTPSRPSGGGPSRRSK